jgi:cytochrome P450
MRADALACLAEKRENAEGASLFSILPAHRDRRLLCLLVAYQVMWDYLDSTSERAAAAGQANGRRLHRALVEALDPDAGRSDYYRFHPWGDDGGYLAALVSACRRRCAELPSYPQIKPIVLRGVADCAIQSVNHETDPSRRERDLRGWVRNKQLGVEPLPWFERAAAVSAFVPYPLLALASEQACEPQQIAEVHDAYFPSMALAIAMLDSYADRARDRAEHAHSYISHYGGETATLERLHTIVGRTLSDTASLPGGHRHSVIAACMVAMYLSKDELADPGERTRAHELASSGGPLTTLLLPAARLWRKASAPPRKARGAPAPLPPGLRLPSAAQTFLFWHSPFVYYERCRRRYGTRFTLRATSHPPFVFLSDPAEIKAIVTAPPEVLHPGEGAATIGPLLGSESFMLLEGEEHMAGRRLVLPLFHSRSLQSHVDLIADVARAATASWPQGEPVALSARLRGVIAQVIVRVVFGRVDATYERGLRALHERLLKLQAVAASPLLSAPLLRRGPGRARWRRFLRERTETDALIHVLIDQRRRCDCADGDDVCGRLLAARNLDGSPLSAQQLRDNVMTMLVAGHESTSAELAWAFQLLAHNPDVQDRLIAELDTGGEEYLTATVQEVLRHRPVFLFAIPRAVKRPIEIGPWRYEPPVHLLACIYLLHHDPALYPEPHRFRPERFLEGQPSPSAWLPWGGGRRRCVGMGLAMLEMKAVLRTVLSSMTICPAASRIERPRWRSVIVTPHAGARVVLHRRRRAGAATRRPAPGGGDGAVCASVSQAAAHAVAAGERPPQTYARDIDPSNNGCPQNN